MFSVIYLTLALIIESLIKVLEPSDNIKTFLISIEMALSSEKAQEFLF